MFKRYLHGVVSFVLATTAGVAIFATPVQAATTGWPQDTTAVKNTYIQSAPDGSVVAANCSQASTAIKVFSATGTTTADVPQRTDGLYIKSCGAQGAVGKDGTVFGIAEDGYTEFAVVAYRGNTKLWERSFPHYCNSLRLTTKRAINSMVVGTDGSLYVANVASQCFNGHYLTKLNPSNGQVVFERFVSSSASVLLVATSKGLVSQDTARVVRFIGYNNTDFASQVTAVGWMRTVDMNARAFTTDTSSDSCSTSTLKMYTPGTATPFSFTMPQCWHIDRVAATSQNGLAMLAKNQDGKQTLTSYTPRTGGGFNAASIVLPDTSGYRSFRALDTFGEYNTPSMQTDTNGNILLVQPYNWRRGDTVLSGWHFALYSPTLSVMSEYDTDNFAFQQTDRFARIMNWAMAKDRLYVSVGYCTSSDPYQCGTQSVTLYAARLARLGADYPRGAVLGVTATTPTCKPVTFIGVRGSGEDPFTNEGLGEPVKDVKDRLIAAGLTNMEVIAVAYPATPVNFMSTNYPPDYADSALAGTDALNGVLLQVNRDCPQTQVVVVAYSQGAQTTDGIRFLPLAIQNQIRAMVLLGDPLFNPTLTSINKGTFGNYYGVWSHPLSPAGLPPRQIAASMTGKTASYCIANDFVCNVSLASGSACADMSKCPHLFYRPDWTQQAATWTRGKVAS